MDKFSVGKLRDHIYDAFLHLMDKEEKTIVYELEKLHPARMTFQL